MEFAVAVRNRRGHAVVAAMVVGALLLLAAPAHGLTAPVPLGRAATLVDTAAGPQVLRIAAPTVAQAAALPDVRVHVDGAGDPYRVHQWGLDAVGATRVLPGERGDGIVVAILDSGVQASHPELSGAVLPGWSAFGDDPTVDVLGHGTGVAGIIAARADDDLGMAGMADGVAILPVKVVDDHGAGWASDVAEGIIWAVEQGADVINLSLTATQDAPVLQDAVAHAAAADVPVIASAGNHGAEGSPTVWPAAYDGVVGVAAVDEDHAPADFASAGTWVDVAAPGVDVFTAAPDGYQVVDGGSFAAPHVAAATAILLAARRDQPAVRSALPSRADAVEAVLTAADDLGEPGPDTATGAGLLDVGDALVGLGPRVVGGDPATTAAQMSATLVGRGRAAHAVVVSQDAWADALPATALAGLGNPILLAGDTLPEATRIELQRALPQDATVHILGGTQAVSATTQAELAAMGFTVRRHAGATRIHTALAVAGIIADQAPVEEVLIASAAGWADAVAGGVLAARTGAPVLLSDPHALDPAVADLLTRIAPRTVTLLGGTAVLSAQVEADVAAATGLAPGRLAGPTRLATALAVATAAAAEGLVAGGATVIDGYDAHGWVAGLTAAPLGLPLVMAGADGQLDAATQDWLVGLGPHREVAAR